MSANFHQSVLMREVLACFDYPLSVFVEGTLGAGGHAEAILSAHPEIKRYIAFEQDPDALEIAKNRLAPWIEKLTCIQANFSTLEVTLKSLNITAVDGILFDLGVSSMQLDRAERGFSFMREGPLDMRMDTTRGITAADIVNEWSEADLGRIFREYGEEKKWRSCARTIVQKRQEKPILTTIQLAEILRPLFPWQKKGINPLTLVFQALRICVNGELDVIESVLPQSIRLLAPGKRLAVISFHSLEDRIVKTMMRDAASDKVSTSGIGGVFLDKIPEVDLFTRKPIIPQEDEIAENPRSRSAKLRIVEKR